MKIDHTLLTPEKAQEYNSLPMFYLAGPYWHEDAKIRSIRAANHREIAANMLKTPDWNGTVYSPITYGHHLVEAEDVTSEGPFWMKQSMPMLIRSDVLLIIPMPGYKESRGLFTEIEIALCMNKPLGVIAPRFYLSPEWDAPEKVEYYIKQVEKMVDTTVHSTPPKIILPN